MRYARSGEPKVEGLGFSDESWMDTFTPCPRIQVARRARRCTTDANGETTAPGHVSGLCPLCGILFRISIYSTHEHVSMYMCV